MNQTIFRVKEQYQARLGDRIVVFSEPITVGYNICMDGNGYYFPEQIEPLNQEELEKFLSTFKDKTLGDVLAEKVASRKGRGVCSFALLEEGKKLAQAQYSVFAACHYSFGRRDQKNELAEAYTHNFYYFDEKQKEQCRELVSWIMNGSPWLHCIHPSLWLLSPKERTDWALNKPLPVNVEAPSNEVLGLVVALRVITEHNYVMPTYLALREKGLSRAQAFLLCAFVYIHNGKWHRWANYNWHHFLSINQELNEVIRFFKDGYFLENRDKRLFKKAIYNKIASQCALELVTGTKDTVGEVIERFMTVEGDGWGMNKHIKIDELINFFKEEWNK